jgi:RNA polymerase sigma-70 factor, ECF subfamily
MVLVLDGGSCPRARRITTNDETALETPVGARTAAEQDLTQPIEADELARFEALYERFHAYVFRTAYALTGDRGLAEEILQDTFVRAYRHRTKLWVDRSPLPWLNRVALNLCYTRLGRRRLPTRVMDDVVTDTLRDQARGPDEWAEHQELCETVRTGIAALPPKHRHVVALYYLDGLSLQETAEVLGVRLGTVKSRLHYALDTLRRELVPQTKPVDDVALPVPVRPQPGTRRPR